MKPLKPRETKTCDAACKSCGGSAGKWYKERVFITSVFTAFVLVTAYFFDFSRPFTAAFIEYGSLVWWAVLSGFIIGGLIDYYVPKEYVQKYFAVHKKRTVFYSVAFGFAMSACCHGILAIAIELYRKGASTASIIAFFLASPWANLPVTILLFGFFGFKALYIVLAAIVIAITTGLIYHFLDKRRLIECKGHDQKVDESFSIRSDVRRRLDGYDLSAGNLKKDFRGVMAGSWSLAKMILWWIILGILMASFAHAFIPREVFVTYLGPTVLGMLITLAVAAALEVCSEGSSPLAFEIHQQTGAFGNSFVFLNAGVATDYTEIGLIWSNIGRRAAILLPIITVPQILVIGYLFNMFL
jgi:uncharacterized membrane protein YraQ (UPF0718 family)